MCIRSLHTTGNRLVCLASIMNSQQNCARTNTLCSVLADCPPIVARCAFCSSIPITNRPGLCNAILAYANVSCIVARHTWAQFWCMCIFCGWMYLYKSIHYRCICFSCCLASIRFCTASNLRHRLSGSLDPFAAGHSRMCTYSLQNYQSSHHHNINKFWFVLVNAKLYTRTNTLKLRCHFPVCENVWMQMSMCRWH